MNDDMTFLVLDENGNEIECEVICTFESTETGKNYIIYTDNTEDEDGNTRVMASVYNPDDDEQMLLPIETEKEWALIEAILDELQSDFQDDEDEDDDVDDSEIHAILQQYGFDPDLLDGIDADILFSGNSADEDENDDFPDNMNPDILISLPEEDDE